MTAKKTWRLLKDEITDPLMHFAVEEALLRLTDELNDIPTLRIRQTEPSVWIGYYQNPDDEVDLDFCKKNKLKIVRRLNSGGAVYQDFGTFCYTAFFVKEDFLSTASIKHTDELYSLFGNVIIDLCKLYNIQAVLSPVNDITVDNKKIYGSAQLDWYSAFAHSGSILVNADLEKMEFALKPSDLKFADKEHKTIRERVINLSDLAHIKSIEQVKNDFIKSFATNLNIDFIEQGLTNEEEELANQLYHEKYSKPEWTFLANKPHSTLLSTKIASGVITLTCDIFQDKIRSVDLSGDFLAPNHTVLKKVLSSIKNKTIEQSIISIKQSELPDDIVNGLVDLINQISYK